MSEVQNENIIVLTDEDGGEHEFEVLEVLEVEQQSYAILQPTDTQDDEAIILRIEQDENGNEVLVNIEDDDEWDKVAEMYDTLLFEDLDEK
jgi:putative Holliday junction resolvase